MKGNIEKHFLFLFFFVFTLSLVNISPLFAKKEGKKKGDDASKAGSQGPVDTEACKKKDTTKSGIEQYTALCKTQCISTNPKYTQFQKDNEKVCKLYPDGTGAKEEQVDNLLEHIIAAVNSADTGVAAAVIPDFTTQALKYEFRFTFNDQLREDLQKIIFTKPKSANTTASYNVLNEDTTITAEDTVQIKERIVGAIKKIILRSFDAPPTDPSNYNDKVIKELRDHWLNVDLKGDATTKEAAFTVDNFKSAILGSVGYSLPHELYHFDFDETLTKAIKDNASDTAAKSAFVEAYKNYVSKNIIIEMRSDTWEDAQSLEFKISLNAEAAQITLPASQDEINRVIPVDLSTEAAFNQIKTIFTVTVARIPFGDLNAGAPVPPFGNDTELTKSINFTGLVPVRVTIAPTAVAPNAQNKLIRALYDGRLAKSKKVFNQRIIALASTSPTTLGATLTTRPASNTLYELIYTQAVTGLTLTDVRRIDTITGLAAEIKDDFAALNDIVNAQVIAVKKGLGSDTEINILLQLDGVEKYFSRFEKLSGVEVSYAHIVNPAAAGAAFVAQANFKNGSFPNTDPAADCPTVPNTFVHILGLNQQCRNLLKITVPTDTTADFGIRDGADLAPGGTAAAHVAAAAVGGAVGAVGAVGGNPIWILNTLTDIRKFTTYFNPSLGETEDHYIYASNAIRNQLVTSGNIEGFDFVINHNWPASEYVQAAIATIPASSGDFTVSLLRATGDPKSVYLTKRLEHLP